MQQQQVESDLLSWFKEIFEITPEISPYKHEIMACAKLELVNLYKKEKFFYRSSDEEKKNRV